MISRKPTDQPLLVGQPPGSERRLDCCGMTHIGRQRHANEDQFLIAELSRRLEVRQTGLAELGRRSIAASQGHLLVVADGMGGHEGGGIASAVAIRALASYALEVLPWLAVDDHPGRTDDALAAALRSCQEQLGRSEGPPRMGTTVTCAYVTWPSLHLAHVGDSRCYLFRRGQLRQLTRDHTVAQRLIDDNQARPEEVRSFKDLLWNAVGGGSDDLLPEISTLRMLEGDTLLLCTDGLTKHVGDEAIAAQLADPTHASPACERLVEAANADGGSDNVTVVVSRY